MKGVFCEHGNHMNSWEKRESAPLATARRGQRLLFYQILLVKLMAMFFSRSHRRGWLTMFIDSGGPYPPPRVILVGIINELNGPVGVTDSSEPVYC